MTLAPGTHLGPYEILAPLGAGGMGEVYRARDIRLGRDVALKVIHAEVARDPYRIKRFEQEARAAGALSHPNVCAIHDIGTYEGSPFVVMELLEGESLRERLRAGPLPVRKAIDYAVQAAHGLAAAHEKGIIHRDLKPENLFATKDGWVKVLDFGLAKLARPDVIAAAEEPTVSIAATETGAILGTVGYMSPEQVRGEAADARSDLFALGAILYELLTGKRAFNGATYVETLNAILKEEPAPLTASGRDVPPALGLIVWRCLEKSPDERFQNARDLAFALESMGSGQGQLQGTPTAAGGPRPRRRYAWAVAAAAVVLVGVGVWLAWGPLSRWLGGERTAQPTKKEWILVAEFEGPPDDSTLATAARSLVSAALDQSEIVATVPRDQIQLALQQAGKPTNTRVSADIARELAYRRAVRAVLEGEIARIGEGYSVVLRVVDADSLKVVLIERGSAVSENALIPALGKLAEKLRRDLGERRSAIAATRPMTDVATPSFEAYRLYVEGGRRYQLADWEGAIALYHEVLNLDPGFSSAWRSIGMAHINGNRPDSALAAYDQAARLAKRLTAVSRLDLERLRASATGDWKRELEASSRLAQIQPENPNALAIHGGSLHTIGRFEEALARYREAERLSPFGAPFILIVNMEDCLLGLGHVDQARAEVARLRGVFAASRGTEVELAACHWAAAESMATAQLHNPSAMNAGTPAAASLRLAQAQAGRGALRAAAASLRQAGENAQGVSPVLQGVAGRALLFLDDETHGALGLASGSWMGENPSATLILCGLAAADTADGATARRLLAALRNRPNLEKGGLGAAPLLLEARVAALGERWAEVVRILEPVAARPVDLGWVGAGVSPTTLPEVRLLLAEAFGRLGAPDSAAFWLERVTSDPATWCWGGFSRSFAHRRLVLLYARMGRLADAERHLTVLEQWWDRPDDVARRMLDEARSAVRVARSMARPERPRT